MRRRERCPSCRPLPVHKPEKRITVLPIPEFNTGGERQCHPRPARTGVSEFPGGFNSVFFCSISARFDQLFPFRNVPKPRYFPMVWDIPARGVIFSRAVRMLPFLRIIAQPRLFPLWLRTVRDSYSSTFLTKTMKNSDYSPFRNNGVRPDYSGIPVYSQTVLCSRRNVAILTVLTNTRLLAA